MADTIDQIILRIMVENQEAVTRLNQTQLATEKLRIVMQTLATQTKSSFKDVGKALQDSLSKLNANDLQTKLQSFGLGELMPSATIEDRARALGILKNSLSNLTAEAHKAKPAFTGLNDVIRLAFGIGLAQIAVQAIRGFINYIKQAIQSGYEFAKAIYQLSVGINVLRRNGLDITIQDIYENLDKLQKKFAVFSKKELVEGSAQLVNLIRDFGLTKDQILNLQDAIATLAVVNGRAMDDVQRTVALALSSGYTEGLQRLGVSINRVTIAQKAATMGYAGNYMALTEQQRAMATLALIMEKVAKYEDDLAAYQETAPGKIDKAKAAWKDFTNQLGASLLPILGELATVLVTVINLLKGLQFVALANFINIAIEAVAALKDSFAVLTQTSLPLEKRLEAIKNRMAELTTAILTWTDAFIRGFSPQLADYVLNFYEKIGLYKQPENVPVDPQDVASTAEEATDAALEMWKEMEKIEEEYHQKMKDAEKEYQNTLADIYADAARKRKKIQDSYKSDHAKVLADQANKERELLEKYNQDVAQAERQFANRRTELEARYRENQIKEEIDYQERLKKIREGFLMDLEDALRERDALAVLRAIRQYNLQKKQAKREHEINVDEMKRNHALEMAELARERAERLRILKEEYELRLRMLKQESAERIAELRRRRQEEEDALKAEVTAKEDKAMLERNQDLAKAAEWYKTKLSEMLANLIETKDLSKAELEQIVNQFIKSFGPNPALDEAMDTQIDRLDKLAAAYNRLWAAAAGKSYGKSMTKKSGKSYGKTTQELKTSGEPYASGGVAYADKPTLLEIGEGGTPEMAVITPINRTIGNKATYNGNPISSLSGGKGNMEIQLLLSPDLIARVVRKSGDMVANVLMEVQRQK